MKGRKSVLTSIRFLSIDDLASHTIGILLATRLPTTGPVLCWLFFSVSILKVYPHFGKKIAVLAVWERASGRG